MEYLQHNYLANCIMLCQDEQMLLFVESASVLPQILALRQNQTSHGPSKSKEELEEEAEEELEEEEEEETVKSPSKRPRRTMSPSAWSSFVPSSVPLNAWLWYRCSKDGAYFFFKELPGVSYTLQRLPRRYEKLLVIIRRSCLTEEELSFIHIFSGLTQASAAWQQNNHQLELQETITLPNKASDPQLWHFKIKEGLEATFVPFMKDQTEEQQIREMKFLSQERQEILLLRIHSNMYIY
ncbi:hypothetical protein QOT17_024176 [Balamuthia mandrillaris]